MPADFDEKLLEQGVLVSLAVKLFDEEALTQRQAAKLAGLSLPEFFSACAARQVPVVRYEAGELEQELESRHAARPSSGNNQSPVDSRLRGNDDGKVAPNAKR